ncbi:Cro/CI family transcriptional regulator [Acinetobacter corruptisaponis]
MLAIDTLTLSNRIMITKVIEFDFMKKSEALNLLQCTIPELAKILNISTEAIYKWGDKPIPIAREYQIKDIAAGRKPLAKS